MSPVEKCLFPFLSDLASHQSGGMEIHLVLSLSVQFKSDIVVVEETMKRIGKSDRVDLMSKRSGASEGRAS